MAHHQVTRKLLGEKPRARGHQVSPGFPPGEWLVGGAHVSPVKISMCRKGERATQEWAHNGATPETLGVNYLLAK